MGVDTAVGVLCLHDGLRRKQAARDDVSVGGSRISWQAGKDHFSSDDVDREFVANDVRQGASVGKAECETRAFTRGTDSYIVPRCSAIAPANGRRS